MNWRRFAIIFGLLAQLVACQQEAASPAPSATPFVGGDENGDQQEALAQPTAPPAAPAATTAPEAEAPEATVQATTEPIPAPALFDIDWRERTPFRANVIPEFQDEVLELLPGATVYHMDVTIAPDVGSLSGYQEILYTNREEVPLESVYFRLFPNLAGGRTAVGTVAVDTVPVEPVFELQQSAMSVPLNQPLQPGESVMIAVNFEVDIPTEGGGNYNTFVFTEGVLALAHFYPMVAVYDDEGWNLEIPPPSGDVVYADSSFYLVRVTAPAGLKLVASGSEIEGGRSAEQQMVVYAAGPMRDFYIVGSESFEESLQQVGNTLVRSYTSPDWNQSSQEVLATSVLALEAMGESYGVYPFAEFDVVSTPTQALGVEYPGVIAINQALYSPAEGRFGPLTLESTVVHEVAHQWFYSLIGNDQLDDPWLDESLTQYATLQFYRDTNQPEKATAFADSLFRRWELSGGEDIPIGLPVSAYEGPLYSGIIYGRGPLFFEELAATIGETAFAAFLESYVNTYQWEIATPEGLQELAETSCDCDLDSLFGAWVYP